MPKKHQSEAPTPLSAVEREVMEILVKHAVPHILRGTRPSESDARPVREALERLRRSRAEAGLPEDALPTDTEMLDFAESVGNLRIQRMNDLSGGFTYFDIEGGKYDDDMTRDADREDRRTLRGAMAVAMAFHEAFPEGRDE